MPVEKLIDSNKEFFEFASLKSEDVIKKLDTSIDGLIDNEIKNRLKIYGHNEPANKKKIPVYLKILKKFLNPLVVVLMVIAFFSLFFGEKISAVIVSLMIFVSVFLDFRQEYRSDKAVEKLIEMVRLKVTVVRNGKSKDALIKNIVPGDIVDLYAGDIIPADTRIIRSKDLFINQASLTGESFPAEKTHEPVTARNLTDLSNIAFMGTSVVSGTALGVVLKTGASTKFGEISKSVSQTTETNFDKGIREFASMMIRFMLVLVISIFFIIYVFKRGSFKEALLFSLAVAVGLTPEMLPMLVTLNLSRGAAKMSEKKVIVKKLSSIQNFGAMDILCTDKTGTLTLDRVILEKHCDISGKENDDVLRLAFINSFYQTGLKNLLDKAILKHEKISVSNYKKVDEIPFDFSRRIMSVVVENKKHIMVSKGAPDEILKRCNRYELNGRIMPIDPKISSKIFKIKEKLNEDGFRVLAVAYKEMAKNRFNYSRDDEKDLILRGYIAFLDPPKPSVKKTIESLVKIGIEVKVLTGDTEIITKKICKDVGLDIKGMSIGDDIDLMDDSSLQILVEKITIFARCTPAQKERIIRALQKNGHVVGYLGDGINDAPALKRADIGISVNNAVDIAKESADIILLEKNLQALYEGAIQGRKTFGNILKYVKMGASSNFGNMLSMTCAAIFIPFLPMLPIQVLLNSFLYDLSNIAVPFDNVDMEYLAKPRAWNVSFIQKYMVYLGPVSSIFDFATYAVMLFVFNAWNNPALFRTGWFLESICTQTLVIFVIRTNKMPFIESWPRKRLVLSTLAVLIFAFLMPFLPIAHFFGFIKPPHLYFVVLFALVAVYLLSVQLVKSWIVEKYGYQ